VTLPADLPGFRNLAGLPEALLCCLSPRRLQPGTNGTHSLPFFRPMKYHSITALLLMIALSCYALGYAGAGWLAVAAGAAFELWFWIRLFSNP